MNLPLFLKRVAKVRLFLKPANFSATFFHLFLKFFRAISFKVLIICNLNPEKIFRKFSLFFDLVFRTLGKLSSLNTTVHKIAWLTLILNSPATPPISPASSAYFQQNCPPPAIDVCPLLQNNCYFCIIWRLTTWPETHNSLSPPTTN